MGKRTFDPDAILAAIARGERSCGDFEMRIDRDGTWFYRGSPIGRLPLVKLFASVLRRAPDGSYWLVTPVEQGRIEVEDAPFVAVELRRTGEGRAQLLELRTNLEEWVPVDGDHPLEARPAADGASVPYLRVRDKLDARVGRAAFYHLVELAEPAPGGADDGLVGVWSAGRFFPLGPTDG
jgi:uncharacterized protein